MRTNKDKKDMPDDNNVNNKLSKHLISALKKARQLAIEKRHKKIEPAHLLMAIAQTEGALGAELLVRAKLDSLWLKSFLDKIDTHVKNKKTSLSKQSQKLIVEATLMAHRAAHPYVGTEHLLKSILDNPESKLQTFGREKQSSLTMLQDQLEMILKSGSKLPEITETFSDIEIDNYETSPHDDLPSMIKTFGLHLTNPDHARHLDPVIGREKEIERLMQILMRRTKNNPVLLGDPGVGKTAVVEGLAQRIVEGQVPPALKNKKILALDVGSLVAGTMFRGEFENRMRQVIEELKRAEDIIVFIDELHTIVGAGAASGSIDAANLLKPALARGEIRCIGATTLEEYRQHIESDGALERRFQSIMVEEPTANETRDILSGLKRNYESHHGVNLTDEALDAAVALSERYLPDRFLPDKAIDLLDEAAARVKIKSPTPTIQLRIQELEVAERLATKRKESSVTREQFEEAIHWKAEAENHRTHRINLEAEAQKELQTAPAVGSFVVSEVLTSWTKIPVTDLMANERDTLKNLETEMGKYFFGQQTVRQKVAETIRKARLGLSDQRRPLASFLLTGPSGVGKTTLAKTIAKVLFGDERALLRFDMSEFSESFTMSKLIGAPAGYVGYKESGLLTEQVRRRPYQVILFDELDRAHRDVYQLLLQILDEGSLRDATGRSINFKQTIIIATANPTNNLTGELGFETTENNKPDQQQQARLIEATSFLFPTELQQRFDAILPLLPLNKEDLSAILDNEINKLNERLQEKNVKIKIEEKARIYLLNEARKTDGGARNLQRIIQNIIENELAGKLISKQYTKTKTFTLKRREKKWILS